LFGSAEGCLPLARAVPANAESRTRHVTELSGRMTALGARAACRQHLTSGSCSPTLEPCGMLGTRTPQGHDHRRQNAGFCDIRIQDVRPGAQSVVTGPGIRDKAYQLDVTPPRGVSSRDASRRLLSRGRPLAEHAGHSPTMPENTRLRLWSMRRHWIRVGDPARIWWRRGSGRSCKRTIGQRRAAGVGPAALLGRAPVIPPR